MSDIPAFIEEYRMAYLAANPGNAIPQLIYRNGWVEFRDPMLTRYRRKQIEAMTASLLYRVRSKANPPSTPPEGREQNT
jgi:hypothetical protein